MQTETTRHALLAGHPAEATETLHSNLFVAPTGLIEEDDDLEDDEDDLEDDELDLDDEVEAAGVETDDVDAADADPTDLEEDDDLDVDDEDDEEEDEL